MSSPFSEYYNQVLDERYVRLNAVDFAVMARKERETDAETMTRAQMFERYILEGAPGAAAKDRVRTA